MGSKAEIKPVSLGIPREVMGMCLAALIILTIVMSLIYWATIQKEEADRLVNHTHEVIEHLLTFVSHVKDAETGVRGYVISNDKTYLSPYTKAQSELIEDIHTLRQLTKDNPSQQVTLDQLAELVTKRLVVLKKLK